MPRRSQESQQTQPPQGSSGGRTAHGCLQTWAIRLALAVGSPLLFFALLELILRLSGFGYPTSFLLPATINAQRCFIQNDRFGWRFFGKQLAREPYPLKLATPKPTGTVRIFV